jgi:myo-inositol-1-phosphate synthase
MSIRVAIVGVGNCASALVQGLARYSRYNQTDGLMTPVLGGYSLADIEIVAAFDVSAEKVGKPLSLAVFSKPNNTCELWNGVLPDCIVQRGPTLDGLGTSLRELVTESEAPPVDVAAVLQRAEAQVLVSYLPVGSEQAAAFYAGRAIAARCAFVNCMPAFIASNERWNDWFNDDGLPVIGDDVKSQLGATAVHRALAALFRDRGVVLERTSQLNVGGNADFYNMLDRERLETKRASKTAAVKAAFSQPLPPLSVHIGPSDYVPWLTDRKWAHIRLEGRGFGGAQVNIECKLEVWDSPNSAGVVVDAIRCAQVALDRGECGAIKAPSAWLMKSPPIQAPDEGVALQEFEQWLTNV